MYIYIYMHNFYMWGLYRYVHNLRILFKNKHHILIISFFVSEIHIEKEKRRDIFMNIE